MDRVEIQNILINYAEFVIKFVLRERFMYAKFGKNSLNFY